jgi:hypothetical protein
VKSPHALCFVLPCVTHFPTLTAKRKKRERARRDPWSGVATRTSVVRYGCARFSLRSCVFGT